MHILNLPQKIIKKSVNLLGYDISKIKKLESDPVIDKDKHFMKIYNKCKEFTMTPKETMYSLYKAVEYVIKSKIPGDFIECGVWRGGSTMIIAYTLLEMGIDNRKIYLYDTYEGMTKPTKKDHLVLSKSISAIPMWNGTKEKNYSKWHLSPLPEVQKNMFSTKYPKNNIVFVKGRVEETLKKIIPIKIAILRLDTDWYASTKIELEKLFPLLEKNGVLIIDDYGHWAGAKQATDEYFEHNPILLNRIDHSARMAIKTK